MESKVNSALLHQTHIAHHAWLRQVFIDENNFEGAMTQHFFFKMHVDEYFDIKESMTQEERNHLMMARTCLDYTEIYN